MKSIRLAWPHARELKMPSGIELLSDGPVLAVIDEPAAVALPGRQIRCQPVGALGADRRRSRMRWRFRSAATFTREIT